MLYAYGATVVEIVRRKEFCEFLLSELRLLVVLSSTSPVFLSESSEYPRSHG
jgi:hypothetical protein